MPSKAYSVSDEEFQKIVKNSISYSDCARALGYASARGRQPTDLIKKRCSKLNISTEHFQRTVKPGTKKSLDEILVENSTYLNMSRLKIRLVNEGLLEYKCAECGLTNEWNNKPLTLQLDHINGVHTDHRLENLRFLCPNCHSQTDTFTTRQSRAKSE